MRSRTYKTKIYRVTGRDDVIYFTTLRAAQFKARALAKQHREHRYCVHRCTIITARPAHLAIRLLTGNWIEREDEVYSVRRKPALCPPRRARGSGAHQAEAISTATG